MDKAISLEKLNPRAKDGFMAAAMPLVMLAVATVVAFVNAWPNELVLDDAAFVGPGRAPQLDNLYFIFTHELWATIGASSGLYRPLLLLNFSLEARLFGDWAAGYHLSNIFLHLLATLLLYGFLRYLLRRTGDSSARSDFFALLAALVFAVHPVHTEVVNSVFNRSEILVTVFGIGGLWWLLRYMDDRAVTAWLGLAVMYLLALFSKESAVIIPGLAVVLILLLTTGDLMDRIRKCLPVFWLILPLVLFLAMRAYALSQPEITEVTQAGESQEIVSMFTTFGLPDSNIFVRVIGVFGETLRVVAWPYPLKLYYSTPSSLTLLCYAGLNLLLIIAAFVQLRRGRPWLAAGLAFFYMAMLPASRLFGAGVLSPVFAERYVYFPSVGLAMILAFTLPALAQRVSARMLASVAMPIVLLLTALTWERNADWASEFSLFETEYARGHHGSISLRLLTAVYNRAGNYARVVQVCDENVDVQEKAGASGFVEHCATAYEREQRQDEAERAHLFAIAEEKTRVAASMSLARFYMRHNRRQDAEQRFMAAVGWTEDPAEKSLYQAEMIIALYPKDREKAIIAKGHLEEALRLRPGWPKAEGMLMAVNRALESSGSIRDAGDDSVE